MQDLIKRYFWVVGVLTVVACAFLAARAVSHVVEEKVLADSKTAPRVPVVSRPLAAAESGARSKDGKPLVDRSMFCAECVPAAPQAAVPTDPSQIPMTSLPLTLIATNVGASPRDSFATIVQTTTETQGSFREGDTVPGAGPIKKIAYRYVDFHADASKSRVERLSLFGEAPPVAPPPTVAEAPPAGATDDLTAMVDRGIKKIDDSNYEIDRSLVDQVLANPMQFSKGARVVPSVKNGKTAGFKLYAIRPNSAFAKLGLSNGDTLTSVNNMELTSADKALEVYTKVKESNTLQIEVTRRGKPMTITYSIK